MKQHSDGDKQIITNFSIDVKESIKSISHHINRKLKVKPTIDLEVELIVSKNKTSNFMKWME